jgi:dynein light chain LC8-type
MTEDDHSGSKGMDMKDEWKRELRSLFTGSKSDTEEQLAKDIAVTFSRKYRGTWHCVIGRKFGSCVAFDDGTHWVEQFGPIWVALWRCSPT